MWRLTFCLVRILRFDGIINNFPLGPFINTIYPHNRLRCTDDMRHTWRMLAQVQDRPSDEKRSNRTGRGSRRSAGDDTCKTNKPLS